MVHKQNTYIIIQNIYIWLIFEGLNRWLQFNEWMTVSTNLEQGQGYIEDDIQTLKREQKKLIR